MNFTGILLIGLFCLLTSFREVFVSSLLQDLDPFAGIFVTFLPVCAFFFLSQVKNLKYYITKCKKSAKMLLILNLSTLASWFGFYFAVQNLEPAISCSVTFALGPLITIVLEPVFGVRKTRDSIELALSAMLGACAIYFLIVSASGRSSLGQIQLHSIIIGFAATILSAFATVFNTFTSKKLAFAGMTTFEIMGARFGLLLIVTGAILVVTHSQALYSLPVSLLNITVMAATVIVPLIVFQKAIVRLPPHLVSLSLASMPLITIFFEAFDHRLHITNYTLAGVLVGFLASSAAIVRYLTPKRVAENA